MKNINESYAKLHLKSFYILMFVFTYINNSFINNIYSEFICNFNIKI